MPYTHIAAAPAAVTDGFLNSVNMKVGAYTLDAHVPTYGARHITLAHTSGDTTDTLGTVVLVGKDAGGGAITETLTPVADSTVTSTQFFSYLTSATGAGWVIDGTEHTEDTIIIGWDALNAVAVGAGTLGSIAVNTTAAGTITVSDGGGTIAVLAASVTEGLYEFECDWVGFLRVETAAASDITVIHSGSIPTYATA